eukprot:scaffold148996_cov27-Tisochrysis_lutea.AAC.1
MPWEIGTPYTFGGCRRLVATGAGDSLEANSPCDAFVIHFERAERVGAQILTLTPLCPLREPRTDGRLPPWAHLHRQSREHPRRFCVHHILLNAILGAQPQPIPERAVNPANCQRVLRPPISLPCSSMAPGLASHPGACTCPA